jgi:hypothetical protein
MLGPMFAKSKYGVSGHNYGVATDHYEGPEGSGAGYQSGNRQTGSFVFHTKDLHPGKPLSLSKLTRTSVYGAGEESGSGLSTPIHPISSESSGSDKF